MPPQSAAPLLQNECWHSAKAKSLSDIHDFERISNLKISRKDLLDVAELCLGQAQRLPRSEAAQPFQQRRERP